MALFNPLSYVVELEAAGVSRQQAQVHAPDAATGLSRGASSICD